MQTGTTSRNFCTEHHIFLPASEPPEHWIWTDARILETPENMLDTLMPQNHFSKSHPKRHVVRQSLERTRTGFMSRKVGVRPGPEIPMAISAVVSLNPESQRIAGELPPVQCDFSRENRVGMRSAGEANPSFVAQRDPKCRPVLQIPRDAMALNIENSPAGILIDFTFPRVERERRLPTATQRERR